ncbi:MAG: protein kinase domain-containing protein [Planctomycetota bacterium]
MGNTNQDRPVDPDSTPTIDPGDDSDRPDGQVGKLEGERGRGGEGGKTLGPYQLLEEIGRGGMGVVYLAFHPQLKRTVALKVLIAGEDASEEAVKRFHREAEAVAKLGHHPNIVPVHDIGKEGNLHYFAMHYVEGKSLDRMIDEGEITPKIAASIAKRVANGLAHAHSHGILHRDVKPANILVDRAGEPQITDFGLAKDVDSKSKLTYSGATLGTPQYMPPEQADGRLKDIDERSDVYSLGATLYEMLAYEPPFTGDTVIEVIQKVLLADPVSPSRKNPIVGKDLATICLKCLEKERDRRYASAEALAGDLENYLSGNPIAARPASFRYRMVKKARRHKPLVATAAVSFLLLIAAGIIAAVLIAKKEGEKQQQVGEAQADAKRADRLREKNAKVAKVMMNAAIRLRDVHSKLKASHYDDTISAEGKNKEYEGCKTEIDEFFDPILGEASEKDASERSTALALKGWFVRLSGDENAAQALWKQARDLDPEVGWGYLFEAMAWLSRYLAEQQLPDSYVGASGVEFDPMPPETRGMKKSRERFSPLLAAIEKSGAKHGPRVWGMEISEGFAVALTSLREIGETGKNLSPRAGSDSKGPFPKRDASAVRGEEAVSALLGLSEFFWMTEELLEARARLKYVLTDFKNGLEDVRAFLKRCPENSAMRELAGDLLHGEGLITGRSGGDPTGLFRMAIQYHSEVLARDPEFTMAYYSRASAYVSLGEAEAARGKDPRENYRKAIQDQNETLRRHPDNAMAYGNRGNAYSSLGDSEAERGEDPRETYRLAIRDSSEALYRNPEYVMAYSNRGSAYLGLGRAKAARGEDPREAYRMAIQDCTEALRREPELAVAYGNRGNAYSKLGEAEAMGGKDPRETYRKAIRDHGEAMRREPGDAIFATNRGITYEKLGKVQAARGEDPRENYLKAIQDHSDALARNPALAVAYGNRGNVYMGLGEVQAGGGEDPRDTYRRAIEDYGAALARNPADANAYNNRGNAFRLLGKSEAARGEDPRENYRKAIRDIGRALARNPANAVAYTNRGLAHLNLGEAEAARGEDPRENYLKAIQDYSDALARNPEHVDAYNNRGIAYLSFGKAKAARGEDPREAYRNAVQDYSEALARNPGLTMAYNNRGLVYVSLGKSEAARGEDPRENYRKAIRDYGEVMIRNPAHAAPYTNRGVAYKYLGEAEAARGKDPLETYRKAIQDQNDALARNPEFAKAYVNRGDAYLSLGGAEAARGEDPRETYGKAIRDFGEALARNPNYTHSYNRRGNAFLLFGEAEAARGEDPTRSFESALKPYRQALIRNPSHWPAHANLGGILYRLGRYREASESYEKALAILKGRIPSLKAVLASARAAASAPPWWRKVARGNSYMQMGWFAGAREAYENAIAEAGTAGVQDSPKLRGAHFTLACCLAQLSTGKKGKAAEPVRISPGEKAELSTKAVDNLRKALELGFENTQHIRQNTDLAPIRDLPEFKALLAEWEEKLGKGKSEGEKGGRGEGEK